jgi:O-antigen ligase
LSPAAVLTLAPAPFALAALIMRPASLDRIVFLAPLIALVLYAALTLAWSPSPVPGAAKLNHWILTGILPIAYILLLAPASPGMSWSLIGTVALISTVALIIVGSDSSLYPGRASLLDANPIWAARAAFIGALVVLFGPFNAWIKVGVAPIIIFGGFITVSLGPALGMIAGVWAGVVASLRLSDRSDRRVAIGWAALGLATATGLTIVVVGATIPQAVGLRSLLLDDPNVTGRFNYLVVAASLFWQAPISGIGVGGFASTGLEAYPHNIVAEVGLELGVIGLVLLGVWVALALRAASRSPILMALVVASAVFALFSGNLASNAEFWLFSGLAIAQYPWRSRRDPSERRASDHRRAAALG